MGSGVILGAISPRLKPGSLVPKRAHSHLLAKWERNRHFRSPLRLDENMASTLADQIAQRSVLPHHLSAWWLGGSGFIFKNAAGRQLWVDPYLSDIVAEIFAQPRAFPAPITVAESFPDIVVSTHLHEDHLDPGFIPALAKARPNVRFVMPPTAMGRARTWGVPPARIITLTYGQTVEVDGFTVTGVPARHICAPGLEAPDAMGVIIETDGVAVYHTGDTEYDVRIRALRDRKLALATLCINGVTGNMNAHEAALLAWHLQVGTVVPHHHLLWATKSSDPGETLDARLFESTYRKLGGSARVVLPEVGGEIDVS
jgi:L-ascorbate metabolism protein UlaG (beta-lactamase superfamily)